MGKKQEEIENEAREAKIAKRVNEKKDLKKIDWSKVNTLEELKQALIKIAKTLDAD
jgi:hypothetical protein